MLFALSTIVVVGLCALILVCGELIARAMEPHSVSGLRNLPDNELGWVPAPGAYRGVSSEFNTSISINSLNMNDREFGPADLAAPVRILALGDSHTFAIGASTEETWPKRLESLVFDGPEDGVVMNAGVIGYSLGQYLVRYRRLRNQLRPTHVVVGFSMATDLYDLVPPEHGGFIYGGDAARVFFDLDGNGQLIERVHDGSSTEARDFNSAPAQSLRGFLGQFALFRAIRRSKLAMMVAVYWRPGGQSLWPGLDTALKVDRDSEDLYRWRLAEAILARLVSEANADGAQVVIVNIPYLAQVYDDVWASSFGQRTELYDREVASRRLSEICDQIGATCVDTTTAFQDAARSRHRWLHWRHDAHPTPEGHQLIAEVVADYFNHDPQWRRSVSRARQPTDDARDSATSP